MPFTVTVQRDPRYLRVTVAGPASLKNYFDLIELAARESLAAGARLGLVDLSGVAGRLHVDEQAFIGEMIVEKLAHLRRLAAVVVDDPKTYTSETVANAKGFQLRSFRSAAEAEGWLLGA